MKSEAEVRARQRKKGRAIKIYHLTPKAHKALKDLKKMFGSEGWED